MLYTKCPACGAAIKFESANEGDEICKLRCPACGKTMCVKLRAAESAQAARYEGKDECAAPANAEERSEKAMPENQENVLEQSPREASESDDVVQMQGEAGKAQEDGAQKRKKRVAALLKNLVCLALSLGFIGLSVACYLSIKGVFAGGNEFNSFYNGIYLWELVFTYPEYFAASFGAGVGWGIAELLPLFIFTLSCADAIVCVVGMCMKRYGKTYHILFGAAVCALSVTLMFVPYINIINVDASIGVANDLNLAQYFTSIFNPQYTTLYFAPAIGVVRLVCAVLFAVRFKKRKKEL